MSQSPHNTSLYRQCMTSPNMSDSRSSSVASIVRREANSVLSRLRSPRKLLSWTLQTPGTAYFPTASQSYSVAIALCQPARCSVYMIGDLRRAVGTRGAGTRCTNPHARSSRLWSISDRNVRPAGALPITVQGKISSKGFRAAWEGENRWRNPAGKTFSRRVRGRCWVDQGEIGKYTNSWR